MFGIRPRLPISEADQQWVENGFDRLSRMLGRNRMLQAEMVLPDAKYFPDPYDRSLAAAERMFCRICEYMKVDRSRVNLELFPDQTEELRELLPYWESSQSGCAGFYVRDDEEKKMLVGLKQSQMDDPLVAVATLAHELGHVILLGGGLVEHTEQDMEPLTDLLTVFLGFGIFNGNCAGRFRQWQNEGKQGWSMQRLGYLPEPVYGYALARFAHERREHHPKWVIHLSTNLRKYFRRSAAWLKTETREQRRPIR
jgi:hypothetical protein